MGPFCESDVDGCDEISCYEGVDCFDVPAPGEGAMCGPCPVGFTGDGQKCLGMLFQQISLALNPAKAARHSYIRNGKPRYWASYILYLTSNYHQSLLQNGDKCHVKKPVRSSHQ